MANVTHLNEKFYFWMRFILDSYLSKQCHINLFSPKCVKFNSHIIPRINIKVAYLYTLGGQWLRYCATNQVTASIPDGVMEFFIDINPSDHTMALGSTQRLIEISIGSNSWG
jgi:hypothetical protein